MTTAASPAPTLGLTIFNDARNGNAMLWRSMQIMAALALLCVGLQFVESRMLNGASVWMKPAKFFFSIAVHLATVSWALMLLPQQVRGSRSVSVAVWLLLAASWFELLYITYRAGLGEASHFNVATPLAAILYNMMAAGAVTMTLVTGYFGIRIWRNRDGRVITDAASIGLVLSAVLATIVGFYLGGQSSHWVGGELNDATGTGFFGWSTTGGDLRVAHFVGLHAAQIVPLAGLSGSRPVVYCSAMAIALATAILFATAVMGIPVFRL